MNQHSSDHAWALGTEQVVEGILHKQVSPGCGAAIGRLPSNPVAAVDRAQIVCPCEVRVQDEECTGPGALVEIDAQQCVCQHTPANHYRRPLHHKV